MKNNLENSNPKEYLLDHRLPIKILFQKHQLLIEKFSFQSNAIFDEKFLDSSGQNIQLSAHSYTSKITGPALWLIAGIHGEEPAGPNALANKINQIGSLSEKIPMVILPLCNPKGYYQGRRYPNQAKYSDQSVGQSVGDSEHLLPDNPNNPSGPREKQPSCPQASALTKHILDLTKKYPPILSLDLHEDDLLDKGYIYSQGEKDHQDPIAQTIVHLLTSANYPLHISGLTRFNQTINQGVVGKTPDGSIDELLAAKTIYIDNQPTIGPSAKSVIVVETSAQNQPLSQRQLAHELILNHLEKLWQTAISC